MIKIPKKLLFKYKNYLTRPEKFPSLRISSYIILFFLLYIFLPLYLANFQAHSFLVLLLFYLINILNISYGLKIYVNKKYRLRLQQQTLQEKLNILTEQNSSERRNQVALQEKIGRYRSLKKIIEDINQNLTLEFTTNSLADIAFSLIANNKGVCVFYLLDNEEPIKLNLYKAKKEVQNLIIKAKEGDIFDFWVLRHTSPLLIEDIKRDFRFDLEKLKAQDRRPISSLISSPLISEHRFLGILRLDNSEPNFYSQDDLRFLMKICDLGAVALENSELFQKTQDLAIHDGLTSLFTRGYFLEHLKEECTRHIRNRSVFSLLMLDIDYFKNYNDKFGHTAGDIVLKKLSLNLSDALKGFNAIISRCGGEEFYVLLAGIDKKRAHIVAEELRAGIERMKIVLRRYETNITVSIGVATFPDDAKSENELLLMADRAMYQAKQKGRNKVICA